MSGARVLVLGATGMVGGIALRELLAREDVAEVTSIGRRSVGVSDERLTEVTQPDLTDYGSSRAALEGQDAALFCVGAYSGTLSDADFRRVTVDCAVEFAEALHAASPDAAVAFLSGQGADPSGKSRMAFARYKGEAERALLTQGFPRVHIFRPGYIYPVTPRSEPSLSYRLMRGLWPAIRRVYPNAGVPSDVLAHAMVEAALNGTGAHTEPVLENSDIRRFA